MVQYDMCVCLCVCVCGRCVYIYPASKPQEGCSVCKFPSLYTNAIADVYSTFLRYDSNYVPYQCIQTYILKSICTALKFGAILVFLSLHILYHVHLFLSDWTQNSFSLIYCLIFNGLSVITSKTFSKLHSALYHLCGLHFLTLRMSFY